MQIMSKREIETFRGSAPRCRNCNKPLRPNYQTDRESYNDPVSKYRRNYIIDPERLYLMGLAKEDGTLIDPPAESEETADYFGHHSKGGFDAKKQQYYKIEEVKQIKSRKFLGTFGARGDSLFCTTECGYRFAVKFIRGKLS